MPVTGFLASIADKASSVLPSHDSHALDSLQHQLRSFGQQYSSATTPVQRIITVEKGVAIDVDSLARNAKAQSKELYTWGQSEAEDLKDVTDRLAYINFVQGSLASSLAVKLDAARTPFKNLRDAEAALTPKRNARAGLQLQITRIENDQPRGMEKRLAELKEQLRKADAEDQPLETEVSLLKRQAVRESERHKWEAIREFGEKLVLLSQAAEPIIAALPTFPPSKESPYAGGQATGAARASLQRALDNYKTGHINLAPQMSGSDLSRSDTRSFGETHARELKSMASNTPSSELAPHLRASPPPSTNPKAQSPTSPPIDPSALNLSPAPIPPVAHSPLSPDNSSGVIAPTPTHPGELPTVAADLPTVAETGVPVSAGAAGPGPASGSLRDIRAASNVAGPRSGGMPGNEPSVPAYGIAAGSQKFESASEEKKRLQAYSEAAQMQPGAPPPARYETAEEEKKRMEREERERLLFGSGPSGSGSGSGAPQGEPGEEEDAPPSYQDEY
ncbi:Eisosome component PIL1-domain-containing protein [Mycena sanguinolenta]|nr:Eisosome component PIL1-domain-containing protein [Mycena sanguinolenta]